MPITSQELIQLLIWGPDRKSSFETPGTNTNATKTYSKPHSVERQESSPIIQNNQGDETPTKTSYGRKF